MVGSDLSHTLISFSLQFPRKLHQPVPPARITRTQTNHVLHLGGRVHGIPRVVNKTLDPNCNSRGAATVSDVSCPISIGHDHDEPCGAPAIRGTSRLQPTTMLHAGFQTLDVDFTSGTCADVSGQFTNCVLHVRTIQPE